MAEPRDQAEEKTETERATIPEAVPAPRLTGIASNPCGGVRIGAEPDRLSKGQRKHLRRQKEAGKPKVATRRSRVSR
jgi:hypothetical protein